MEHLLSRLAAIVIVETLTKAATIEIEARLKRNCSASSRCETALSTSNMGGNAYATEVPLHFHLWRSGAHFTSDKLRRVLVSTAVLAAIVGDIL